MSGIIKIKNYQYSITKAEMFLFHNVSRSAWSMQIEAGGQALLSFMDLHFGTFNISELTNKHFENLEEPFKHGIYIIDSKRLSLLSIDFLFWDEISQIMSLKMVGTIEEEDDDFPNERLEVFVNMTITEEQQAKQHKHPLT